MCTCVPRPLQTDPTPPRPHPRTYIQSRKWQQAEVRVGHFVLPNKWVPDRPQPTPELQAAPRVTHGSQRRGAAAALLAAGMPTACPVSLWVRLTDELTVRLTVRLVYVCTCTTAGGAEALLATAGPMTRRTRQQLNLDADDLEAAVGGGSGVRVYVLV